MREERDWAAYGKEVRRLQPEEQGCGAPAVNGGASPERLFNSNKFQIGCGSGWDCLFPSGPQSPSRHEFPRISIRDRCEPQSVQTAPEPDFDGGY
jgi:hypothetical protein